MARPLASAPNAVSAQLRLSSMRISKRARLKIGIIPEPSNLQTDIRGRIFSQLLTFVIGAFAGRRKVRIVLIAEEGPTTLMILADEVIFRLAAPCLRVSPDSLRRPKGQSSLYLVRRVLS